MRASSQKPEFHLNANAGIVLTLQCRVLTLTLPVQWPYKFPSLPLWPHNPKPSLAGNYMHFNTGNKRDLTSKYFAVMGFGIWTLNARWYSITGFFTWSFKWASSLQSHKKNHWGVWNFDSHWLPKVTPIRERYLECVHFQQIEGWEILKKVFWKSLFLNYTNENPRLLELVLQVVQLIRKLYRIYTSPVLIMQRW